MDKIKDPFPGHDDAGKVVEWIKRQISDSALGKGFESALQAQCGEPISRQ